MRNDANMETVIADVRTLSRDAGAMLRDRTSVAGEKMAEMRDRLSDALKSAKAKYHQLEEKAAAGAKATDRTIRAHPYESIGIALGAGVLLGWLMARR